MTAQHDFEYEQLSSARYVVEQSVDKKGRQKTTYSLICMHKNGDMQKVPLSNEVAKTAASQLVAQLIESGVPVTDQSSSGQEMFNQNIGEIRPTTFTPQFLTD